MSDSETSRPAQPSHRLSFLLGLAVFASIALWLCSTTWVDSVVDDEMKRVDADHDSGLWAVRRQVLVGAAAIPVLVIALATSILAQRQQLEWWPYFLGASVSPMLAFLTALLTFVLAPTAFIETAEHLRWKSRDDLRDSNLNNYAFAILLVIVLAYRVVSRVRSKRNAA